MIVYARNLSPFGRRVMAWLALQGRPYRQEALAPMEHFDAIREKNPGGRVPILELDDGRRLIDSAMIVDHLEATAAPELRLIPAEPEARLETTQAMAHAHGLTEKAVAYVYEKNRRPEEFQWPAWRERLAVQIAGGLAEVEARTAEGGFAGGARPNGADIVGAIAYDFIETTNPDLLATGFPKLAALSARANALDAFKATHPKQS